MLLGKISKMGRKIEDLSVGDKLTITEKMEDKDLLLYLGLTNDNNPLYIQHDYASQTLFEKPIVPPIMLTGIITSAISKYLPGPGSHLRKQSLNFPIPTYHYSVIDFTFEVKEVHVHTNEVVIQVFAQNQDEQTVVEGVFHVSPPLLKNK
ncbi:MaoC/PaaZ C-terminal domain-containing protein [Psychrobacillus vulpis]|uniref:Enoyl-CoA hydratase n=1 Tax=Psychrobacillus vulpis TaxID=2325572 RepID=A0A544TR29_9BACI|nr:MaoC/PaaZ C-terminal domain-containing protein [Psychrobacillus vulpis]TQR19901.1 enoyl-CoA hydratase [Psychrobacillus vulpis]